jgi:hypothetical protein
VELLILVTIVVGVGLVLWVNDCNHKTNIDLMRCLANILKAVSTKEITQTQCSAYLAELEKVTYNKHLFRLVTLRDPSGLYSPGLAKFF